MLCTTSLCHPGVRLELVYGRPGESRRRSCARQGILLRVRAWESFRRPGNFLFRGRRISSKEYHRRDPWPTPPTFSMSHSPTNHQLTPMAAGHHALNRARTWPPARPLPPGDSSWSPPRDMGNKPRLNHQHQPEAAQSQLFPVPQAPTTTEEGPPPPPPDPNPVTCHHPVSLAAETTPTFRPAVQVAQTGKSIPGCASSWPE